MSQWWVWLWLAAGVTAPLWVSFLGWLYATAVYGLGTWSSWMAENEPGEFGPYIPRWRRRSPASVVGRDTGSQR
jgi:hypothetical protein